MGGNSLNQEAIKQYSQEFSAIILDDFFANHDGISGQQIVNLTPVKQINFFILKVLFEQWQEETKKFKSPFFNYKNEEVKNALKGLINTLSKNIFIEKEDFRGLLERAVEDTLILSFAPITFFENILSQSSAREVKSSEKYYKMHKSVFQKIIALSEEDSSNIKTELAQIFESHSREIQQEKDHISAQLEEILALDIFSEVEIEEYQEEEEDQEQESEIIEQEPTTFDEEGDDSSEDLEEEFAPMNEDKNGDEHPSSINDQFANDDIQTLNDRYEEEDEVETIATKLAAQPVSNLVASITINQQYMFVNDLFDGNGKDYQVALAEVDNCQSFDDAVELLVQNYAKKYAWDMNSEEVKDLLKVIFKRFR